MLRREFLGVMGGAAATWPLAARAQQPERMRRIGVLMPLPENDPQGRARIDALREGLPEARLGRRPQPPDSSTAGLPKVTNCNRRRRSWWFAPDLILVQSDPATAALRRETWTIPIVFVSVGDPIGGGFIQSMARPAANATGFTNFETSIGGKWLELLRRSHPE